MHESIQTKIAAQQTREQLLSVIAHSKVTLFTVDQERRVTMLEGSLIWDKTAETKQKNSRWFIGQNMYTVFNWLNEQLPEGEQPEFLRPIEDILDGRISEGVREHGLSKLKEHWLVNEVFETNMYRWQMAPYSIHAIQRQGPTKP
jgi:hypothetical protein